MEPQQTKTDGPTPEQLLKLLDLQIAAQKAKRSNAPRNRAAFLALGIVAIVGAALAALLVLSQMAGDLARPAHDPSFSEGIISQ